MEFLGIELGSTRIKALLMDEHHQALASGSFTWENRLENGIWTYPLEEVWHGLQQAYQALVMEYGAVPTPRAMGVSAMMHGYLPFDAQGRQLTEFRTWRNTMTAPAAQALTQALGVNIPQRWSVAHLYQALLRGEAHLPRIAHLTTLAGYVHWQLTGEQVLGVGDASGMFPLDAQGAFDAEKLAAFTALSGLPLAAMLPQIRKAGEPAGCLTPAGALLLDPSGALSPGIPLCPPEGDAGTGMVATNSVAPRTGNVSAGTSIFAMVVLEGPLSRVYPEIDLVATPCGKPVAMVHCNNCSCEIDAWLRLFDELLQGFGLNTASGDLYPHLFRLALQADPDCGGLLTYNYISGEHVTGFAEGRPLIARLPGGRLTLANLMRSLLHSALATLALGMELLSGEHIAIQRLSAHGGLFKTPLVGQQLLAAALGAPVCVMGSAGEGGAWGIAVLAAYLSQGGGLPLSAYLDQQVFAAAPSTCVPPDPAAAAQFAAYLAQYKAGLAIERSAVEHLRAAQEINLQKAEQPSL